MDQILEQLKHLDQLAPMAQKIDEISTLPWEPSRRSWAASGRRLAASTLQYKAMETA